MGRVLKVAVLGEYGVGKTSLLSQYVEKEFIRPYQARIALDFLIKKITIDKSLITLRLCDTGGQERFQSPGPGFYRGVDCCVLVFDVNSAKSFDKLESWRDDCLIKASPRDPDTFPFVVLGNKIDMAQEESIRQVSKERATAWCQSHGSIPYFETSAKFDINIDHAFESLARCAIQYKPEDVGTPITIGPRNPQNPGCSC